MLAQHLLLAALPVLSHVGHLLAQGCVLHRQLSVFLFVDCPHFLFSVLLLLDLVNNVALQLLRLPLPLLHVFLEFQIVVVDVLNHLERLALV